MSTLPWDASSLDLIDDQVIEHTWRVELPTLDPSIGYSVPAWDVEVSLDGGRAPYGTATFKVPLSYMAEVPDGAGTVFSKLVPYGLPPVRIWAGWKHAIDGAVVDDSQILFAGFITKRQMIVEEGRDFVLFEAQTAEAVYDQPNSRTGTSNVGDAWTSLKDACTTIAGYVTPWYRTPTIVEEAGYMNTPSAGQLSSWRALTFETDDEVMDLLIAWAAELGQWVRGNVRSALTTASLLVSADPYPYRTAYALPQRVFTKVERLDDVEQWANILKLTANWVDATSGDPKSKKRQYVAAGVVGGTGAVRSKAVTLQVKPSGGTLTATTPIALQWLRRISDMCEVFYTAQGRAIWWLQPRLHGLSISDLGLADAPGPINTVTFQVDTGTMTVTWATNNTRT